MKAPLYFSGFLSGSELSSDRHLNPGRIWAVLLFTGVMFIKGKQTGLIKLPAQSIASSVQEPAMP
jgi:hypothetical protein